MSYVLLHCTLYKNIKLTIKLIPRYKSDKMSNDKDIRCGEARFYFHVQTNELLEILIEILYRMRYMMSIIKTPSYQWIPPNSECL